MIGGTTKIVWLRLSLSKFHLPFFTTFLWCDDLGVTFLVVNPVFHSRNKYVEVDYHFIHGRVAKKEIQVQFFSSID